MDNLQCANVKILIILMCGFIQVMDIVDRLFVEMFDTLNQRCQKELEAIGKQYPFKPLKVIETLFTFIVVITQLV